MPNWSTTNIMFFSKNKEQLEKLNLNIQACPDTYRKDLKDDLNKVTLGKPIGTDWIGTILYKNKMITKDQILKDSIPKNLSCRGRFTDMDYEVEEDNVPNPYLDDEKGFHFYIQTGDAWEPCIDMWDQLLMEKYPDIKFVYISEEGGNGYYENSDEYRFYWKDDYILDITLTDLDSLPKEFKDEMLNPDEVIEEYTYFEFDHLREFMKKRFKGFDNVSSKEEFEEAFNKLKYILEDDPDIDHDETRFNLWKFED